MRFAGKTALVTGGSRGIGRAIVERLAKEGADVAFLYRRDQAAAEELASSVASTGHRCLPLRAEMANLEELRAAFAEIHRHFDHLDIFVANAASTAFKPLLQVSEKNIDLTYAITVKGFIFGVQEAAPLMPDGGRIVAMSGCDSFRAIPGHGVLGSAKAAMEALVRYFAHELGERGITVNAINPGYVDTDSAHYYLGSPESHAVFDATLADATPLRAMGQPEEVASLTAFLCSDEAAWIQGQTIYIDGGVFFSTPGHSLKWRTARGWR